MAIQNPRKKFNFRITILPLPTLLPFEVQEVTLPDLEIEQVEHGFGNTVVKTAGLVKPGNCTINRILTANAKGVSREIWEWANLVQDGHFLSGSDPIQYKRTVQIDEMANDGVTALTTHYLHGCWPTRINGREFNRTDSANTVESFELSVDSMTVDIP